MKKFLTAVSILATVASQAGTIENIRVQGDADAVVEWKGDLVTPTYKVKDNTLELTFPKAQLAQEYQGKYTIENPHALIQSLICQNPEKNQVRCKFTLNGSAEGVRDRLHLSSLNQKVSLKIDSPKVESAVLNLLREEQKPLQVVTQAVVAPQKSSSFFFQALLLIVVLSVLSGAAFFGLRWLKTQGKKIGTRKFLVETLSYAPIGGSKSGVGLLKVGTEFVLVGVTPTQISFLSNLPKLQEQYERESSFDRDVFQEAVQEEMLRMKKDTSVEVSS